MRLLFICLYYLLYIFVIKCSAIVIKNNISENIRERVRRQDGYVYDKPSISFDLPSRLTSESTQAPTVDRTLAQHMYYAYPAPARGDTINIGSKVGTSVGTTESAVTPGPTSGYNYQLSAADRAGYNYGTPEPVSTGVQANSASQVSNVAPENTVTSTQSATNTNIKGSSEYSYSTPSPTLSASLQGSSDVSTNAPKYLPPIGGSRSDSLGSTDNVDISNVSDSSNAGLVTGSNTAAQTSSTSVGALSASYLPPLVDNTGSTGRTATSINSQTNSGGPVSVPSTAYLPPKSSPSPTPIPTGFGSISTSQPAAPTGGYIPPSNTASNSGTVTTPASGYLPPQFF